MAPPLALAALQEGLRAARERLLPRVEESLQQTLGPYLGTPSYYGMMRYHLGWADERLAPLNAPTGKRLRPLLCLLAAEACGGTAEVALPAAVALELLHNFTLIHDDIEDGDALRHHRPTVWKLWGEPQGINAGDGMHVLAQLALYGLVDKGVPASVVVSLATRLAQACLVITEGQHLDLSFESRADVTPTSYLDMIGRKSAALMGCAAATGAEVAGAEAAHVGAAGAFAYELGMGFQVRDDVLGIWGAAETTGKPAGDLRRRKKTLPSLWTIGQGDAQAQRVLTRLFETTDPDDRTVTAALEAMERCGARAYCEAMVSKFSESARGHLRTLRESPSRDALEALIAHLEIREF